MAGETSLVYTEGACGFSVCSDASCRSKASHSDSKLQCATGARETSSEMLDMVETALETSVEAGCDVSTCNGMA